MADKKETDIKKIKNFSKKLKRNILEMAYNAGARPLLADAERGLRLYR